MGFIQKLATRNPRVYEKSIKKKPKYIVEDHTLYEIVVTKKKSFISYLNPKNWF